MRHPLMRLLFFSLLAATLGPVAVWAQVKAAPPISGVIGKVEAVTSNSLEIQTESGVVNVAIEQPLTTYRQVPSDLSHVSSNSYVGIPSVRQENGTELAKQIMIFPAELRGAAEVEAKSIYEDVQSSIWQGGGMTELICITEQVFVRFRPVTVMCRRPVFVAAPVSGFQHHSRT